MIEILCLWEESFPCAVNEEPLIWIVIEMKDGRPFSATLATHPRVAFIWQVERWAGEEKTVGCECGGLASGAHIKASAKIKR